MNDLELCLTCQNKAFNRNKGVVCGLTDEKPDYVGSCEKYLRDERAYARRQTELADRKAANERDATAGLSRIGIKNPLVAGIILTALALIVNVSVLLLWGVVSLWLILFLIGAIFVLVKALADRSKHQRKAAEHLLDDDLE
jgi:Flp pilus assembly protein TadB